MIAISQAELDSRLKALNNPEWDSDDETIDASKITSKKVKSTVLISKKSKKKATPVRSTESKQSARVLYLSHIPHGFYEAEMNGFFSQFGEIRQLRLVRSRKSGRSKGFAFIEFAHPAVAQIVANTMNGYYLFEKKLVCDLVEPSKVHKNLFLGPSANPPPRSKINREAYNKERTQEQQKVRNARALQVFNRNQRKLEALGISYDVSSILSALKSKTHKKLDEFRTADENLEMECTDVKNSKDAEDSIILEESGSSSDVDKIEYFEMEEVEKISGNCVSDSKNSSNESKSEEIGISDMKVSIDTFTKISKKSYSKRNLSNNASPTISKKKIKEAVRFSDSVEHINSTTKSIDRAGVVRKLPEKIVGTPYPKKRKMSFQSPRAKSENFAGKNLNFKEDPNVESKSDECETPKKKLPRGFRLAFEKSRAKLRESAKKRQFEHLFVNLGREMHDK